MNKEIKFRVPIECNACKFKGFQYFEWNGQSFTPSGYDKCECKKLEIVGEPQQYTGLKDKNGKEIYEGDILSVDDGTINTVRWAEDSNSFSGKFGWRLGRCGEYPEERKVIGNIFENPYKR